MIKFLVTVFCIYLILKWIVKPLLKIAFQSYLQNMVKKHGGQFHKEYRYQSGADKRKKEGSINVDYVPPPAEKSKKMLDDQGEYVDFEEVK